MKVLYIFGNGLDLAFGMKTSYPDFYRFLIDEVEPKSPMLKRMMEEIGSDPQLWSDMELAFGKFTSQTDNVSEFIDFYKYLNNHLRFHLMSEMGKFDPSKKEKEKFLDDLRHPFRYLIGTDSDHFRRITSRFDDKDIEYNMITLNYTYTLENLLNGNDGIPNRKLVHVHGQLDNGSIIIGVSDVNQISNEKFRQSDELKDNMIKSQTITAMKATNLIECQNLISNADVILLYGVSLGETDGHLWQMIRSRLNSMNRLIIIQHIYGNKIDDWFRQDIGNVERTAKETFTKRLRLTENEKIRIKDKFFILVSDEMFVSRTGTPKNSTEK